VRRHVVMGAVLMETTMNVLWKLAKLALALVLIIPVGLLALGVVGTVLGLMMLFVRLAVLGLVAYGAFKLITRLFAGPSRAEPRATPRLSEPADSYYRAAMRELDSELPEARVSR
jgi:hypothetical protein